MPSKPKQHNADALDKIVSDARRHQDERAKTYRERALKLYPWICGRCEREFTRANLPELTVHHRNHNHDDNPSDGSNWELLCLYCHDNEHQRQLEAHGQNSATTSASGPSGATHNPFAALKNLLDDK
ncbi:MAG: HNH nuclease family protein [Gammaproteobacteria bacterium]|nr:HNH nuclease family protein [Gammaproteobacteria bacterium]